GDGVGGGGEEGGGGGGNRGEAARQVDLARRGPEIGEAAERGGDQFRRLERLERIHLGDVGDPRVREDVVDEPHQPPRLLHQQLRVAVHAVAGRDAAAEQRLGRAEDRRERRLEL